MRSTRCRLGAVRGSGVLEAGAALGGEVRGDCEAQAGQSHLGRGAPVLMRLSVYELRRRCRQPGHDADQEGPGATARASRRRGGKPRRRLSTPPRGTTRRPGCRGPLPLGGRAHRTAKRDRRRQSGSGIRRRLRPRRHAGAMPARGDPRGRRSATFAATTRRTQADRTGTRPLLGKEHNSSCILLLRPVRCPTTSSHWPHHSKPSVPDSCS